MINKLLINSVFALVFTFISSYSDATVTTSTGSVAVSGPGGGTLQYTRRHNPFAAGTGNCQADYPVNKESRYYSFSYSNSSILSQTIAIATIDTCGEFSSTNGNISLSNGCTITVTPNISNISAQATCATTISYTTPSYQPGYWNYDSAIRQNNNCYNYANNKRTDTFAQPGRASGVSGYPITGAAVYNASIADGLVPTTLSAISPEGKTKIALVVAPGYDYHWYRQDSDGRWTHKPGSTNATNVDNSGAIILNPQTANRGPYTEFVGYFFTPSDAAQGQGKANIR